MRKKKIVRFKRRILSFANSKREKRGKTTEEFIVSVTCRLHRSETCARWKEGKSKIHLLFVSSLLNFMPQTHTIRLRSKSSQNDFALLFLWMPSIGYLLCVFTTHTKQRRWWWRNLTFFCFVEGRFVFCILKINQDVGADLILFCRFSALYFNHFAFHFHRFGFMSASYQSSSQCIEMLVSFVQMKYTQLQRTKPSTLSQSVSITKELTIVKNYRLAMQPENSTRKIQI